MASTSPKISPNQYEKDLAADLAEFYDDPFGFVMYAFPWGKKGTPLEDFEGPDVWQAEQLIRIGEGVKNDPLGTIREAIASGHGIGKILSNINELDTPDGFRAWGDIQVGDRLFGKNGLPTRVIRKSERESWDFYKVSFSDGTHTYAGKEHLWSVTTRDDRYKKRNPRILNTEEIMGNLRRGYQIPMTEPVEYQEQEVPVEPYLLGYVLGNGCLRTKSAVKVACIDPELYEYMEGLLPEGLGFHGSDSEYQHISSGKSTGVNQLVRAFEKLGLNRKKSPDKFIPKIYKFNSSKVRIEVLRGLMDSDGTVSPRIGDHNRKGYRVQFSTSSVNLRDDMIWLVKSIGGTVNYSIDSRKENNNYEVHTNFPQGINPFRLERKKRLYEDYVKTVKRPPIRVITAIEYDHTGPGHCVEVDAPDHLYLANDFIVTHNTAEVAFIILWAMSTRPHLNGVVTANTLPQLTTKTWRELAVWHKRLINKHWFKWSATKFYHVQHPETWFVAAIPNTEHNSEAFAGLHATHVLVIYDESSGVPDKIFEVSEGAMTTVRAMWFIYGNPTKNTGRFRECFNSDAHRWTTRQIDSRQAMMTNKKEISEWVDTYGEDSDFVRVRVRGVFPRSGDMQFIGSDIVDRSMKWECPYEAHFQLPILIGVDVARYGDDKSVISIRQGRKLLEQRKFRELNTMQVATVVADAIREYRPAATFVDGIGVGAGVVDRLRMLNYEIVEVNAGVKADDAETYFNKRAEMLDRVRIWLRDGADIPDDVELRQSLIGIEYSFDAKELMRLERKQDMKRRGLDSPDELDSLGFTFAEVLGDYTNNWFEPEDQFEPEGVSS